MIGDKRIQRNKFLFLPMTLDGKRKWLQRASWEEEYTEVDAVVELHEGFPYYWKPLRWVDD